MAPDGNECFYVLSPVPNLKGTTNWEDESERFKNFIYERLEQTCLPNLRNHIVTEKVLHPGHFEKEYKSQFGSGFSIAPTLKQSAYLRFHNKSEDFNNLYFVGAGTHPGAGMPGVICSAKVLDKLVPNARDYQAHFRHHSKTFSFAARFLGKQQAINISKLYYFFRYVDDIADGKKISNNEKEKLLNSSHELNELNEIQKINSKFRMK